MSGLILPAGIEAPRPNRAARRAAGVHPGGPAGRFPNVQPRRQMLDPRAVQFQVNVGRSDEHVIIEIMVGPQRLPIPFLPKQAKELSSAIYTAALDLEPDEAEEEEQEPETEDGRPALQEFCQTLAPVDDLAAEATDADPGPARAG